MKIQERMRVGWKVMIKLSKEWKSGGVFVVNPERVGVKC